MSTLLALHLSDSGLPIGRFSHSYGIEIALATNPHVDVSDLVATFLVERMTLLDGPVIARVAQGDSAVALAHQAAQLRTDPIWSRLSMELGAGMLRAAPWADDDYLNLVAERKTCIELPAVLGTLAAAYGIEPAVAVMLEMRATANAMLQAAVRKTAISALGAQRIAAALRPAICEATETSLTRGELADPGPLANLSSTTPPSEQSQVALFRS